MRDVTLKQLQAFSAFVQGGTFAAAAEVLHVTPPAVAQQIRLLERRIGLPLVDRGDIGPRLTDAGREVLTTTSRIEAELEGCRRHLELIRNSALGTVCLGAVSTAKYFAPQLLAAFRNTHPGIDVQLVVGNRDDILGRLSGNQLDLAVMGRPPKEIDVVTARIGDHPSLLIASPRHPLAGRRRIDQQELAGHRFLVREPGSGTRLLTEWFFASAGIEPVIAMEIASNETIKQAVMADLGIAMISAHTVAAEIDDERLAVLDVVGLPIMRRWYAVRRSSLRPGPAGLRLWEFLVAHTGEHLPVTDAVPGAGGEGQSGDAMRSGGEVQSADEMRGGEVQSGGEIESSGKAGSVGEAGPDAQP